MRNPLHRPPEKEYAWPYVRDMADAIVEVMEKGGIEFFDQLTDVQLHAFSDVLWGFHMDCRNEWVRRRMEAEQKEVLG